MKAVDQKLLMVSMFACMLRVIFELSEMWSVRVTMDLNGVTSSLISTKVRSQIEFLNFWYSISTTASQ